MPGKGDMSKGNISGTKSPPLNRPSGIPLNVHSDPPTRQGAGIESPGGSVRELESQRHSRVSMNSPSDYNDKKFSKGRFTGRSTLKNPFG